MNKTLKYIVLLTFACFVGKGYAQELKSEVFSLLNLDYPGLEKVKALHQEGKDEDAAKALLDYYRARTNVKTPDINLKTYRHLPVRILCSQRLPAFLQLRRRYQLAILAGERQ